MKEKIKDLFKKIPEWVKYEIKSTLMTFGALFLGYLAGAPLINEISKSFFDVTLDLPTIQELKDIVPVVFDALYRAIVVTILTKLGFSHRK